MKAAINQRIIVWAAAIVCQVVIAGCGDMAEQKENARSRWQNATCDIRISSANEQFNQGLYSDAENTVSKCVEAGFESAEAHFLLGKIMFVKGDYQQARQHLLKAVELDDQMHQGWYWLGMQAAETKDYRNACNYYHRAMALQPGNIDYILNTVRTSIDLGQSNEAQQLLEDKMLIMPSNVSIKITAADLMLRLGRTNQAIRLYEQAALLNDDEQILESLAYCYMLEDNWEAAAKLFEKLVEKNQNASQEEQTKALVDLLAMCNMNAGRYTKAAASYGKLAVMQRDNADVWLKMGQAALGSQEAEKALVCSRKALSLRPGWDDAIALQGCAEYLAGRFDNAINSFEKIAANQAYEGFSWFMQAKCCQHLGQHKKAQHALTKAQQLSPDSKFVGLTIKSDELGDSEK
ncbi:MAG: tetratricopeptide repeat protein [Sedimentisphaerales bacterium]|nr:tetratricopeptide repeat protein [Sedimentisphaerales bacterium]